MVVFFNEKLNFEHCCLCMHRFTLLELEEEPWYWTIGFQNFKYPNYYICYLL